MRNGQSWKTFINLNEKILNHTKEQQGREMMMVSLPG